METRYHRNITDEERVRDKRDLARMADISSDELELTPYERYDYFAHKPKGATMFNAKYHQLAKRTKIPSYEMKGDSDYEISDYRKTKETLDREEAFRKREMKDTMTEVLSNKGIDPYMHKMMIQYVQDPASVVIGEGRGMARTGHHLPRGWSHPLVK